MDMIFLSLDYALSDQCVSKSSQRGLPTYFKLPTYPMYLPERRLVHVQDMSFKKLFVFCNGPKNKK